MEKLSVICNDFFEFAIDKNSIKDFDNYNSLYEKAKSELEKIVALSVKAGISDRNVDFTKYALSAYFDEKIVNSECSFRNEWVSGPLQVKYYGDSKFRGGIGFFEKLEKIKMDLKENIEIAKIYYYCLMLGFKGKYLIEGRELLNALIKGLAFEIKESIEVPKALSHQHSPSIYINARKTYFLKLFGNPWISVVIALLIGASMLYSYELSLEKEIKLFENILSRGLI